MSARSVRMNPACSEANVVGLLSELKRKTLWTSSLPEGDLGEYVLSEYRSVGVDLSTLVRKPNSRIALYFMEPGEPPMPANVIYDREYTPFRTTGIDEYDGDTILDTRLIFLTGITAALTDTTADVVSFAADEAAKKGIDIALDVDFRSKLWSGEHARQVLEPIAKKLVSYFVLLKMLSMYLVSKARVKRLLRSYTGVLVMNMWSPRIILTAHTCAPQKACTSMLRRLCLWWTDLVPVILLYRPPCTVSFLTTLSVASNGGQKAAEFALTHMGDLTRMCPEELDIPLGNDINR